MSRKRVRTEENQQIPSSKRQKTEILASEIPPCLKRLVRMVVRAFLGTEHKLIIDALVHHPCISEEDLMEYLKFDPKQIRPIISTLKLEKFIQTRAMQIAPAMPDGKPTHRNYYFINYKSFVNTLKYKLDQMRRKIETDERNSTNSRAMFKCPQCKKTFGELEVDLLFDRKTGEFHCTACNSILTEIENNNNSLSDQNSRMLVTKFNENFAPIFDLLREAEGIRLAPDLLEPEPTDMSKILQRDVRVFVINPKRQVGPEIKIGFGECDRVVEIKKELPIWMARSTVIDADKCQVRDDVVVSAPIVEDLEQVNIMQVLLEHEKKNIQIKGFESRQEIEVMDDDDDDVMITIGDIKVPLDSVTGELIKKMSQIEKDVYIKLSREVYANMYE
uniref:HTH TFE/IIEalpha-type domain-containing protein n=1 Tax=Strigamia maritima TaxID=126957 RepID=T1II69_STRMM